MLLENLKVMSEGLEEIEFGAFFFLKSDICSNILNIFTENHMTKNFALFKQGGGHLPMSPPF